MVKKKFILFDNDGVLVDTEKWYFAAAKRALSEIGFELDIKQYLSDMAAGLGTWQQAKQAGVDALSLSRARTQRDIYYQNYLRHESIEINGVCKALRELSGMVSMAIVTTAKRSDFELIHGGRRILEFMDFVLTREHYSQAKPDPEPYLTGLRRFQSRDFETLVVEDSSRGLQSAVAAGIDCAIVHNDFTSGGDFTCASAKIETLAELPQLVSNWR